MWLIYLVWCSKHNRIIPGDLPHFEWPYLYSLEPEYSSYLEYVPHIDNGVNADIRLGSNRAWLNFFLNIVAKKNLSREFDSLIGAARLLLEWQQQNVDFNLDWCLIFEDPEQFIAQLNSIANLDVKYNSITQQAFTQYRNSCVRINEYTELDIRAWNYAILNWCTDKKQPLPQRLQIAEEMFYNTYYKI